jgi:ABC-type polysaccharide/polyol phosphate transport system ATPase subunit
MALIKVDSLNFTYRVLTNHQPSLKGLFSDFVKRRVRLENYEALKNITFEVERGEVVAIIGRNGAGKSTLLKLLAQVIPPTQGSVSVKGSIAPMIELSAGFHPELTGRENVIFYSTLLGRDLKKTKSRVEQIAKWAGVEDHLDYPLRTFSSGMIARLAFSTATDQTTDVILIDEVLSVGDGDFQIKSKDRINRIINSGSAVVLVSHDLESVLKLSDRVIWLDKGTIRQIGTPKKVIPEYRKSVE